MVFYQIDSSLDLSTLKVVLNFVYHPYNMTVSLCSYLSFLCNQIVNNQLYWLEDYKVMKSALDGSNPQPITPYPGFLSSFVGLVVLSGR